MASVFEAHRPLAEDDIVRAFGQVSLNVAKGVHVTLGNRSTGRITVTGWDRDVISARAVSERGQEAMIIEHTRSGTERVFLKADYADLGSSDPAGRYLDEPPMSSDSRPVQIHLEVNLPRYAAIEPVRVIRSDVQITGIEPQLTILGSRSSIILKQIGAADVRTSSGNVEIENSKGLIQVSTATGAIRVWNASSGVRAVSIAGPIELKCVQGRVDVSNTDAPIDFFNVSGDVDAVAANSSVRFEGELTRQGRYHLRSMSGRVEMIVPAGSTGFSATLSSYRGRVESDFPLKSQISDARKDNAREGEPEAGWRLSGQFGSPGAQIWLDSFEGLVRLSKKDSPIRSNCKPTDTSSSQAVSVGDFGSHRL